MTARKAKAATEYAARIERGKAATGPNPDRQIRAFTETARAML